MNNKARLHALHAKHACSFWINHRYHSIKSVMRIIKYVPPDEMWGNICQYTRSTYPDVGRWAITCVLGFVASGCDNNNAYDKTYGQLSLNAMLVDVIPSGRTQKTLCLPPDYPTYILIHHATVWTPSNKLKSESALLSIMQTTKRWSPFFKNLSASNKIPSYMLLDQLRHCSRSPYWGLIY